MGSAAVNVNVINNAKRNCLSIGLINIIKTVEMGGLHNISRGKYRVTIANIKMF
jgi:hypothetical protein